ncbi:MAG: DUF4157 domain-containing protein, partial [Deltaproteobacteria bacterium]|nr:DUF4157 domain-containing protein [Deltaproteobacteria bacterium]
FMTPQKKECRSCAAAWQSKKSPSGGLTFDPPGTRTAQPDLTPGMSEPAQPQKPVQRRTNRTGMPDKVKDKMERSFNTDFSNVTVHANSSKAPEVGALAYTQGSDIHFAPGHYSPGSSSGNHLLGHELAHVVQQSQGRVKPTGEVAGLPLNDSPALEKEADNMGRKA